MAGNANLAEQGVDTSLVNAIADLQRQLRDLKSNPQPVDVSSFKYKLVPDTPAEFQFLTVPGGSYGLGSLRFSGDKPLFMQYEWLFTVYVDAYDAAHRVSTSTTLTTGQRNHRLSWYEDLYTSVYDTSHNTPTQFVARNLIVRIDNIDSAAHSYYIDAQAIIVQIAGAVTVT